MLLYVIIGVGLLFLSLGIILTENNAKYILSGYNTMSEKEREQVDIKGYVPYFKKFHYFLGISFTIIGVALHYWLGSEGSGFFLLLYPSIAYIYFIWSARGFYKGGKSSKPKWAIVVLAVSIVLSLVLVGYGYKENTLSIAGQGIEISGMYGEKLSAGDITSVEMVEELPSISFKLNGYAMGEVYKGYFKTKDGEKVKLVLNAKNKPYILITKKSGQRLFYAAKEQPNEPIYQQIKESLGI